MNNAVIMHFPAYSGGKFIMNCLCLSKYTLMMHNPSIKVLIKDNENYEYRLHKIMTTLPSKIEDMSQWVSKYEFGDIEMYGDQVSRWHIGENIVFDENITTIIKSNMKFFITAHSIGNVNILLEQWNEATVITLINYEIFQKIAFEKKSDSSRSIDNANESKIKYNMLAGPQWPIWDTFQHIGYNINKLTKQYPKKILQEICNFYPINNVKNHLVFNIDDNIYNKDNFLKAMKKLYDDMNFDDFNEILVEKYWKNYIKLHKN